LPATLLVDCVAKILIDGVMDHDPQSRVFPPFRRNRETDQPPRAQEIFPGGIAPGTILIDVRDPEDVAGVASLAPETFF
jgi:hypothetical protein